jgi:DNA modification methylase
VELSWFNKDSVDLSVPEAQFHPLIQFDMRTIVPSKDFSQIKWSDGWKNRIIHGDSLLAMAALCTTGFSGKIQMIYCDPPFGISYVAKFSVGSTPTEGYQDCWKAGLASYLSYLRYRLVVMRELLHPTGSIFVQIGETNVHYVRCLLDEIFGEENFVSQITFRTAISTNKITGIADYLLWYAKEKPRMKRYPLFTERSSENIEKTFTYAEKSSEKTFKPQEIVTRLKGGRQPNPDRQFSFQFQGQLFTPPSGFEWKWDQEAMKKLADQDRLTIINGKLYGKRYLADFPDMILTNIWTDTSTSTFAAKKTYTVQTNPKVLRRCLAATTDRGDLVLDPTSGSGTTAVVAEEMERRWIVVDTSPSACLLSTCRILGTLYPILQHNSENTDLVYQTGERVSLSNLAHDRDHSASERRDIPMILKKDRRIAGLVQIETISLRDPLQSNSIWADPMQLARLIQANGISFPNGTQINISNLERIDSVSWDAKNKISPIGLYKTKIDNFSWNLICFPVGTMLSGENANFSGLNLYPMPDKIVILASGFESMVMADIKSQISQFSPKTDLYFGNYHPDLLILDLDHLQPGKHPEAIRILADSPSNFQDLAILGDFSLNSNHCPVARKWVMPIWESFISKELIRFFAPNQSTPSNLIKFFGKNQTPSDKIDGTLVWNRQGLLQLFLSEIQ